MVVEIRSGSFPRTALGRRLKNLRRPMQALFYHMAGGEAPRGNMDGTTLALHLGEEGQKKRKLLPGWAAFLLKHKAELRGGMDIL